MVTTPTPKQKIHKKTNPANIGIILLADQTLQSIRKGSGPLANNNEYQVHYHSLVLRLTAADKSIIDICVPTVFFNYRQQVTSAHIDFELTDVEEISTELVPLHNAMANSLLPLPLFDSIKQLFPNHSSEILSVDYCTLHKHPGSPTNQSFSSTDLNTNANSDLGIVFPLSSGDMKPSFSGIMAHNGTRNMIAHYEYRIANGKEDADITYYKGRCAALIKSPVTAVSESELLFGITPKTTHYHTTDNLEFNNLLKSIHKLWDETNFVPNCDLVQPDNVSSKSKPTYTYYGSSQPYLTKQAKPLAIANMFPTTDRTNNTINAADVAKIRFKNDKQLDKLSATDIEKLIAKLALIYFGRKPHYTKVLPKPQLIATYKALQAELLSLTKADEDIDYTNLSNIELMHMSEDKLREILIKLTEEEFEDESLVQSTIKALKQMNKVELIYEYDEFISYLQSELDHPGLEPDNSTNNSDNSDYSSYSTNDLITELSGFGATSETLFKADRDQLITWHRALTQ